MDGQRSKRSGNSRSLVSDFPRTEGERQAREQRGREAVKAAAAVDLDRMGICPGVADRLASGLEITAPTGWSARDLTLAAHLLLCDDSYLARA